MIALALLLAALPPLPPFPTEVRPRDGTTAPANAALFALGDPAPAPDQVGFAVTVEGAPAALDALEAVGCCVVRGRLSEQPAIGDVVNITITSASGEASATWTAGPLDDTPPTFTVAPSVIDHGQRAGAYELVIGLEVADDTQVGMVTATLSDDTEIVGATVDGFVLKARIAGTRAAGELCLDVVVVDVAENASAPEVVCVTVAPPSEGEGEGEGEGEAPGCTGAGGGPLAFILLLLLGKRRALAWLGVASVLALPTVAHAGDPAVAPSGVAKASGGVSWRDGSLEDVMALAKREKKLVLVEVWASWCGPCQRQAADVFETADGAALTKGMLAWRVEFDAPAQRALMEKWNVLSLPTVLVLRPDGTEVDRIEGYETKDAFLVEARTLAKGLDPLPSLEKRLAALTSAPKDAAERARLTLEVGHRKLVRSDPEGLKLLERAILDDVTAQDALFLVGRYHSRVKRDFATAKHVWRELYTRFPSGAFVGTAAWWYAGALHETHDDALAVSLLEQRARTFDKSALESLVDFAVEKTNLAPGVDARATALRVLDDAAKARALDDAALAGFRAKLAVPAEASAAPPKS